MSVLTDVNNKHLRNFVDLSEIITCRLCGVTNLKLKYIFLRNNVELKQKIHDALQIEISFDDPIDNFFPKQICEVCCDRIDAFSQFKVQCQYFHSQWMSQINGNSNRLNQIASHKSTVDRTVDDKHNSTVDIAVEVLVDSQSTDNIEGSSCQQYDESYDAQETDVFFDEIEWIDDDDEEDTIDTGNTHSKKCSTLNGNLNGEEESADNHSSSTRINRFGFSYKTTAFNYIRKTDNSGFECKLCGARFKWSHQCELHVRYHTKETPFICPHCNRGFMAKHYLNSHIKDVHRSCEFICKTCGRQFTRKYLLTEHEMEHSGSPKIQCPQCNLKFYGTTKLTAHIRNYHSNRNCTCDICGKTFKTKVRLSEHRIRHFGNKDFRCNHCDKGFVTKRELTVHLKRENHLNNLKKQSAK